MTVKERLLNKYLQRIASNLDISETMRKDAETSYQAVGKWLGDSDELSEVKIMPQGSFNLGTVIKPVSDKDEYDIDLVCLLKKDKNTDGKTIKNAVGERLKENKKYSEMLEEGKRCWTLSYNEFHMDILPCVPNNIKYEEPLFTEVKLTHKVAEGAYIPKYSNPYKYHKWFEKRMEKQTYEMREQYSKKNSVEIDKVPIYKIKTPLQQAIQLLKRHRDVMYDSLSQQRKDNAPISIIITTLAAHAYDNEDNLFDALKSIINKMANYIVKDEKGYRINNPAMENENFADKWNENPLKAKEFYGWLSKAKSDILDNPFKEDGLHNMTSGLEQCFGKNIVQRSLKEEGEAIKKSRENGSLYIEGLKGGLKTESSDKTTRVREHNFFGK